MEPKFSEGERVQVTECVNFPDLNGRCGAIMHVSIYATGVIEYTVRFSERGGDWDWVKEGELILAE